MFKEAKSISISILLIIVYFFGNSQEAQHEFEIINTNIGLSNDFITGITQDYEGLIWIGTQDGLNTFDGYAVKKYKAPQSSEISTRYITKICSDTYGNIWFMSSTGIGIFQKKTKSFIGIKDFITDTSFSNASYNYVTSDYDKNIWLLSRGDIKLFLYKNNKLHPYIFDDSLNTSFNRIEIAYDNTLLIRSGNRDIIRIFNPLTDSIKIENYSISRGINIREYTIDNNGNFWIGAWGGGLYYEYIDNNTKKSINFRYRKNEDSTINSNYIKSLYFDNYNNTLWIGTPRGLNKLDFINEQSYQIQEFVNDISNPKSLNSIVIEKLYVDNSGIIWVGTQNGGVNKLDLYKKKFVPFGQKSFSKFHTPIVSAFFQYNTDTFFIGNRGSDRGLVVFDRKNETMIGKDEFPIFEPVRSLNAVNTFKKYKIGNKTTLWFGSRQSGVRIIEFSGKLTESTDRVNLRMHNDQFEGEVHTICRYNDSIFLVGVKNGMFTIKTNPSYPITGEVVLSEFVKSNRIELKDNNALISRINSIEIDKHNNAWIATEEHGIVKVLSFGDFSPENIKYQHYHLKSNNGLTSNEIYSIFKDNGSEIWIGTLGGGLLKYISETDKFRAVSNELGWGAFDVNLIIEDNNNNLWVGTELGLINYKRDENGEEGFRIFNVNDGLQGNIFYKNTCLKSYSGELYFGGPNGFNIINPDNISLTTNIPSIKINTIRVFHRDLSVESKEIDYDTLLTKDTLKYIELAPKEYAFSILFASLSYSNPEKNNYSYMLENFDKDWQNTGSDKRFVYYSNLDPGEYIFKVKASNSDGVWNNTPEIMRIIILTPWYKTWWFRILLGLFIIGGSFLFYYIRLTQIKRQKEVLEKKVDERTKELKEANYELQEQKEEILAQNEEIQQQAEELITQRDALEEQNEEIHAKNEQIVRSYDNMKVLSEFGQKVTMNLSAKAINNMIYEYVHTLMDANAFGIGLYLEKINAIEYPVFIEDGKKIPYFKIPLDKPNSMAVWCFTNNKEIYINNYLEEYKNYIPRKGNFKTSKIPMSVVYLPLISEDKTVGIITVQSYNENAYSINELNILKTLASYISIALLNAHAYSDIRIKNKKIQNSIQYAKTIQESILPVDNTIAKYFELFTIFKPKDVVSGDFYWFHPVQTEEGHEKIFTAVVDCTGHGVPGAFMSLIGSRLLNEIVGEKKVYNPAQILEHLNVGIQVSLKQDQTDNNDGMDLCLCCIEELENEIVKVGFSGAKRPLYYYSQDSGKIEKVIGSRKSIGGIRSKRSKLFYEYQEVILNKGDIIYLTTDGYVDQNSPARKRFGTYPFLKLLNNVATKSIAQQKELLESALVIHMDDEEQRDDITLLGLKLE